MSHDTVGERGVDGCRQQRTADDTRFLIAPLPLYVSNGEAPRRQHRAGNHRRNGIEDVMPRPGRDIAWQLAAPHSRDVFGQLPNN